MFGYWGIRNERVKALFRKPEKNLHELMPNLRKVVGDFKVACKLRIRPIDHFQWRDPDIGGIVAIGDAWSSSCPGAGTGTTKVIQDVIRLCEQHLPYWLNKPVIAAELVNSFYNDTEKLKTDLASISEAYKLKSLTLDRSLYWRLQRFMRFAYHGLRGSLSAG